MTKKQIHIIILQLFRNHMLDYGMLIKAKDGNTDLHNLDKKLYQEIINKDGDEVRLTKINWDHCETVGSDRKVLEFSKPMFEIYTYNV